jgi:predicted transcriptional regulator
MMDKKREIFTRIEKVKEISDLLKEIKTQQTELNELFTLYDRINLEENKLFENWNYSLEEVVQKLDYITL